MATNKFILLVEGLSRTINALDIDKNMLEGTLDYPIDLVVFNIAKLVDDDGENEDNSDRVRFEWKFWISRPRSKQVKEYVDNSTPPKCSISFESKENALSGVSSDV